MIYTFYELAWFFLLYSFAGWCGEVMYAAVRKHRFINRGFVSGPLCPIYGSGAVVFAVFLSELTENIFFLFLGGMILATFLEYLTGRLMELIFHRKWWDYSGEKFQFDGYICLKSSLTWGVCAVILMLFTNRLLCEVLLLLPEWLGILLLLAGFGILGIDCVGSWLAVWGLHRKAGTIREITKGLHRTSKLLENALTRKIQKRMVRAFPNIEPEKVGELKRGKKAVFAEGCSFYKLFALFFIGALLGDLVETIFCWITMGRLMSRSSVVYGPFSIVWGLACAILTAILYRVRDKSDGYLFMLGTVLGGAYEYVCSVFTELVFGTVFWDYSGFAFNLGGRINLLYCFFWGIAAVLWIKVLYPRLSNLIERLPKRGGTILCNLLIIFMVCNMLISSLALGRYTQRHEGAAPDSAVGRFLDERFPDARMEKIYPKAVFKGDPAEKGQSSIPEENETAYLR